MYPYTSTSLTLRAKWSSYHHHHNYSSTTTTTTYCSQSPTTLFYSPAPRNPRFIYYGAYLLRFQPSRAFLLSSRPARVRNLEAAIGLLDEEEEEEDHARRSCCRCCCCCRCSGDADFGRSVRKETSWKGVLEKSSEKEGSWSGSDHNPVKMSSFLRDADDRGVDRKRRKGHGVARVENDWDGESDVNFSGRRGLDRRRIRNAEESVEDQRREQGRMRQRNVSSRREGYDLRIRDGEENAR